MLDQAAPDQPLPVSANSALQRQQGVAAGTEKPLQVGPRGPAASESMGRARCDCRGGWEQLWASCSTSPPTVLLWSPRPWKGCYEPSGGFCRPLAWVHETHFWALVLMPPVPVLLDWTPWPCHPQSSVLAVLETPLGGVLCPPPTQAEGLRRPRKQGSYM